jgi:hypothetical protein
LRSPGFGLPLLALGEADPVRRSRPDEMSPSAMRRLIHRLSGE